MSANRTRLAGKWGYVEARSARRPERRRYTPMYRQLSAGAEMKYFDSVYSAAIGYQTGWATCEADPAAGAVFTPVAGAGQINREGRLLHVHSIKVAGQLTWTAEEGAAVTAIQQFGPIVRLLLVMDKQTNGVQLNSEDVVDDSSTTAFIMAHINPDFFGKFRVLADKVIDVPCPRAVLQLTAVYDTFPNQMSFKMKYKFKKPLPVRFNDVNGGTVGDIIDNSFHMLVNMSEVNDSALLLSYRCRVGFKDY